MCVDHLSGRSLVFSFVSEDDIYLYMVFLVKLGKKACIALEPTLLEKELKITNKILFLFLN